MTPKVAVSDIGEKVGANVYHALSVPGFPFSFAVAYTNADGTPFDLSAYSALTCEIFTGYLSQFVGSPVLVFDQTANAWGQITKDDANGVATLLMTAGSLPPGTYSFRWCSYVGGDLFGRDFFGRWIHSASNDVRVAGSSTPGPPGAPVANFTASPLSGPALLTVTFTDTSTGAPDTWQWEISFAGVGSWTEFSTEQNPGSLDLSEGSYDVRLTVTNPGGSNAKTRSAYITVSPAGPTLFSADQTTWKADATTPTADQT